MQTKRLQHDEGLKVLIIGILCFAILLFPSTSSAASLRLLSEGITEDNLLKLSLYAETSQISPFNAVSALLSYPKEHIEIVEIDTSNSILSLWPEVPTDVEAGIIFSGGTTVKGGFIFKGKILDIYAKILEENDGSVVIENAQVLASDGVGTDILTFTEDYTFLSTPALPESFDLNKNGSVSITELSISLVNEK